jgi:hypothetical protein
MTSTEPPDRRERRERDKERTKSPSTGGGSLNRQTSRNVRVTPPTPETFLISNLIFLALFLLLFLLQLLTL